MCGEIEKVDAWAQLYSTWLQPRLPCAVGWVELGDKGGASAPPKFAPAGGVRGIVQITNNEDDLLLLVLYTLRFLALPSPRSWPAHS